MTPPAAFPSLVPPSRITIVIRAQLADAIFWIAVACCAIAQTAIVRATWRASGTRAPGARLDPPRRASEVAWTIIPAVILAVVLLFTWRAMHPSSEASSGAGALSSAAVR